MCVWIYEFGAHREQREHWILCSCSYKQLWAARYRGWKLNLDLQQDQTIVFVTQQWQWQPLSAQILEAALQSSRVCRSSREREEELLTLWRLYVHQCSGHEVNALFQSAFRYSTFFSLEQVWGILSCFPVLFLHKIPRSVTLKEAICVAQKKNVLDFFSYFFLLVSFEPPGIYSFYEPVNNVSTWPLKRCVCEE